MDVAGSAGAHRDLYAWITTTAHKTFGDFSADNATRESAFSETLKSIYFAHSPTCAARAAKLEDSGLVVTVPPDRWDDPVAWAKANPNLGISVKPDDLKRQALKAKKSPSSLAAFKRLRLNVRMASAQRYIDSEVWKKNSLGPFDPAVMHGRKAYGALDLSSKIDLSAWVLLFPPIEDETRWRVVPKFWMPADTVEDKSDRDKVQYRRWIDEGWIEVTPGNVIDHAQIGDTVREDCRQHEVQSIAYDPWNATQLAVELSGDGHPMVEFIQGLRSYTAPTKELEAWLLADKLDHGGNPVLAWMASNLMVQTDKNMNRMPTKLKSTGRIDGMSALIMAMGRAMADDDSGSAYKDRGLLVI